MNAAKIFGKVVLGLIGLAALLYLIGLAINWKDRPPSAQALAFQKLLDARPPVPDAENAYVYLLGINARGGQDPIGVGARRLQWMTSHTGNGDEPDPTGAGLEFRSAASAEVENTVDRCADGAGHDCAQSFRQLPADWRPDELGSLALHRYRTLLGLGKWREPVPLHIAAPIPGFGELTYGQRLHLLALAQLARQADADAVREGLNADSRFWRGVLAQSSTLISQMIAAAALRNHYFFGNLVLRELPAHQRASAVPEEWRREYSAQERSMRQVMAGEWAISTRMIRDLHEDPEASLDSEAGVLEGMMNRLSLPFLHPQDTANDAAADYARFCARLDVPMSQYQEVLSGLKDEARGAAWFSVYNPIGTFLNRLLPLAQFANYAYRAASTEGMRRAALLVAELRAREFSPDQVPSELAAASLRDPYTNAAFEWDAEGGAVVFTGPEKHAWRRYEFFY
jgi:hypothetical protein